MSRVLLGIKAANHRRGGGSRLWLPSDLSSLIVWFNIRDLSSLQMSGTSVLKATDLKSGFQLFPAGNTVTRNATGLNSTPCILTSNPWARLENNGPFTGLPIGTAASTLACTMKGPPDGYRGWVGYDWRNIGSVNNKPGVQVNSADLETSGSFGANGNVFVATYAGGSNGTERFFQDGTQTGSRGRTFGNSAINMYMGPNTNTGPMYIAEFIICTTELGTSDRQKLEGYLAWGAGMQTQLVAGHPYKTAAPTISLSAGDNDNWVETRSGLLMPRWAA